MQVSPSQPPDQYAVDREIRIAARPQTIFPFFTDPAKMMRWKGVDNTLDARPGGLFRVNTNGRDIMRGEFLEVTPYTRIVFTWGTERGMIPIPVGSSTVEITFTPDGGETIVRLRHFNLPDEQLRDMHGMGWDHYLPRLKQIAEGIDPGVDPWAQSMTMGETGEAPDA
jgi:uncharacterized protein YndB with AHSA1/START domain